MADLGLLAGLAQGLQQGLGSYRDTKQSLDEQALKKRLAQAQLMSQGLTENPDTQSLEYTPEIKAQKAYDAGLIDATSPQSQRLSNVTGQFGKRLNLDIPSDLSGIEAKELNKQLSGSIGREITAQRFGDRNSIMQEQLAERKNQNAVAAGQAYEKDPMLKQLKTTTNSLNRAESLLNGNTPINSKAFNVLQQDFINAMAPGGAATEGKVNREMVETAAAQLNELKLKFGNVSDLRKEQPQIVQNIRDLIKNVKEDYANAQEDQALNIHDSFKYNNNSQVQQTNKSKLAAYAPKTYSQVYGQQAPNRPTQQGAQGLLNKLSDEDQQALQWAKGNPNDPRSAAIIKKLGL